MTKWINGWVKEGKNGTRFFSFAFKEKEERKTESKSASQNIDDDIPF